MDRHVEGYAISSKLLVQRMSILAQTRDTQENKHSTKMIGKEGGRGEGREVGYFPELELAKDLALF